MREHLTLNAPVPREDLCASALYRSEVAHLPFLSRKEQVVWVQRARLGEQEARHRLVLNCLHWSMMKAFGIYDERRPPHVDVLDLIEEANLAMLEHIEKALSAHDPVAYLMVIATHAMRVYCTYHAPMIQRPEWFSRVDLQELNRFLSEPAPLDEMLLHHSLASPFLDLEGEGQREHRHQARFGMFYKALFRLPAQHRSLLIRLYGLCGQPTETPHDMALRLHGTPRKVYAAAYRARIRFAKALAEVAGARG